MHELSELRAEAQRGRIFAPLRYDLRRSASDRYLPHVLGAGLLRIVVGMRLVGVNARRRDSIDEVRQAALAAGTPSESVVFRKTVDTQAVEQNWVKVDRHKATLRHSGKEFYFFYLHRIAHLLNKRRWNMG